MEGVIKETMIKILIIVGLILTLIATIFLFFGSQHQPWEMQTVDGVSEEEKAFVRKKQIQTNIGFSLLFVGFLTQLMGVIIQKRGDL